MTDWGHRTIVLVDEGGCAYWCTLGAGHLGPHRWEPENASRKWRELVNRTAVTVLKEGNDGV